MRIEIGKILKPQGIKGELKVLPLSSPEFLCESREVYVGESRARIIKSVVREGYGYIFLDSVKDRNEAENMRDLIISVDEEDLGALPEDKFYFKDLIDCEVFSDGDAIGRVVEVENYGAADIITIHSGFSSFSVPFLRDVFVSVDVKAKKIEVDPVRFREVSEYED